MNFISGIIIIVGLMIGFGCKLYFGEVVGEKSQDIIEKVIEVETGIDVDPIFDLDNKDSK